MNDYAASCDADGEPVSVSAADRVDPLTGDLYFSLGPLDTPAYRSTAHSLAAFLGVKPSQVARLRQAGQLGYATEERASERRPHARGAAKDRSGSPSSPTGSSSARPRTAMPLPSGGRSARTQSRRSGTWTAGGEPASPP